jgi:hypothetical protein
MSEIHDLAEVDDMLETSPDPLRAGHVTICSGKRVPVGSLYRDRQAMAQLPSNPRPTGNTQATHGPPEEAAETPKEAGDPVQQEAGRTMTLLGVWKNAISACRRRTRAWLMLPLDMRHRGSSSWATMLGSSPATSRRTSVLDCIPPQPILYVHEMRAPNWFSFRATAPTLAVRHLRKRCGVDQVSREDFYGVILTGNETWIEHLKGGDGRGKG